MSIIGRYVFRQALSAMVLILLSLSGVVWIALALRELKLVTSNGQDSFTLFQMTTLALPGLIAIIAPVALMIAAIHVINRLNNDSELIILSASGANIWTLARPLLILALAVSVLLAFSNHYVMPWSLRLLREKIIEVRSDLLAQVLTPGRFSRPEDNVIIHIRDRRLDGTLEGILMHDTRNPKELITYLAETGRIVKQPSGSSFLTMSNGHILRAKGGDEPPELLTFANYGIDLERFEGKLDKDTNWRPRERYFDELVNPDPKERGYKRKMGHYRAELHERLSNPLYPFAFVLIIVAYVGQAQSTRQNRVQATATGFFVAASFRVAGIAANNVVVLNASAVPLLYIIPVAGIGLGLIMLFKRSLAVRRQTAVDRFFDRISDAVAWLIQTLKSRRKTQPAA
ncbi:MAG: LPS export ABC transporter permease LptF [Alphaproteobacteria bacterium]|nr:LPS export ABC transporter permease LptF [Alphaproteobacteria bacterium]